MQELHVEEVVEEDRGPVRWYILSKHGLLVFYLLQIRGEMI